MSFTSFMIQFPNGETKLKGIGTASQANRTDERKTAFFTFITIQRGIVTW